MIPWLIAFILFFLGLYLGSKRSDDLQDRLDLAEEVIEEWLAATPTKENGCYDSINQPQAYKASFLLGRIRGSTDH